MDPTTSSASSSSLESFLSAVPTASPLVSDNTLWRIGPGAAAFTPAFPACHGARIIVAGDEDGEVVTASSNAVDSASDLIKNNLKSDGSLSSDKMLLSKGMLNALSELGSQVGWDRVAKIEGSEVTLSVQDLTLTLKIPDGYPSAPPEAVDCQLPRKLDLPTSSCSLSEAYSEFQLSALAFRPVLDALRELDSGAWVIDPERPTGRDLHRRVVIKPGVTLLVTIDDVDSGLSELPLLKLLGPDSSTEPLRRNLARNADRYDPCDGLMANLERILEVEFPTREEVEVDGGVEYNVECCVCYSVHLGNSLPEKNCENLKCGKRFHSECLFEYLQSNVENVRSMGTVFGNCPYCDTKISCREPM